MDPINTYSFYEFGAELQALKETRPGDVAISEAYMPLVISNWRLGRLLQVHDPIEIVLSRTSAQELKTHLEYMIAQISPSKGSEGQD